MDIPNEAVEADRLEQIEAREVAGSEGSRLSEIIQAATRQWDIPLSAAEAEDVAHEIESRGTFTPARDPSTYPSYPNARVRDMVEALDSGRLPS